MNKKKKKKVQQPYFPTFFNVTVVLCVCVGQATVKLRNVIEIRNCLSARLLGRYEKCFKWERALFSSARQHRGLRDDQKERRNSSGKMSETIFTR